MLSAASRLTPRPQFRVWKGGAHPSVPSGRRTPRLKMAAAGRVQRPGPRPARTPPRPARIPPRPTRTPPRPARTPPRPARSPPRPAPREARPPLGPGAVKEPSGEPFGWEYVLQSLLAPVHSLSTEGSFPLLLNPARPRPFGSNDTGSTLVEAPLEWVDNMRVPNSGFAWGSFLGFIFLIFSIRGWLAAGGKGSFPGC